MIRRIKLRPGAVALALGVSISLPLTVFAADNSSDVDALKEQIRVLMKKVDDLSKKQDSQGKQIEKTVSSGGGGGDRLDKILSGFYGVMDASIDDVTKGMAGMTANHMSFVSPGVYTMGGPKGGPVGRVGWQPDLSTNKSGFGYRGDHLIGDSDVKFIYQFETAVSITATPGLGGSYTSQSNTSRGLVGFGDTFIGLKQGAWGSLKFGTTYTPYKKATDRLNPFSGMIGDYAAVMGNSGGDNRVEFGTRQDHSLWWESPKMNGFSMDVLYSPGQNRTYDNVVQSSGSPDCNGGNIPGSGNLPMNCDDGGFNNSFSTALKYETKKFYATTAYELHQGVNRNSDGIGAVSPLYNYYNNTGAFFVDTTNPVYGATTPFAINGGTPAYLYDIGNEWAFKVGMQYITDFGLTISGMVERLRRDVPAYLEYQNERSRDGTWLALTERMSEKDELSAGWAHAGASTGDPGGQHNYDPTRGGNTADMYTVAYKRKLDKQLYWYFNAASTVNHGNAHYDLGAGGRGVTTDCHDGTNPPLAGSLVNDGSSNGPTTWGGCHIIGVSTGLHFKF